MPTILQEAQQSLYKAKPMFTVHILQTVLQHLIKKVGCTYILLIVFIINIVYRTIAAKLACMAAYIILINDC